ncbi:hypothetical protein EB093_03460 [bacterium]|nr:hypothetical protein [bacterium]
MIVITPLDQFTSEQTAWLVGLLETVMVHRMRGIEIDGDNEPLVASVIAFGPESIAKVVIDSLAASSLLAVAPAILNVRDVACTAWFPGPVLDVVVQQLPASLQKKVLEYHYLKDPITYRRLKQLFQKWQRVGSTFVTAVKAESLTDTRCDTLRQSIQHPSKFPSDVVGLTAAIRRDFDPEDVEKIICNTLDLLGRESLPLATADHFKTYLKIYVMIENFAGYFSADAVAPWNRRVVDAVYRMPTSEWILKVLDQFNAPSIRRFLDLIDADTRHKTASIRAQAIRTQQAVSETIDTSNFENVRLAIG